MQKFGSFAGCSQLRPLPDGVQNPLYRKEGSFWCALSYVGETSGFEVAFGIIRFNASVFVSNEKLSKMQVGSKCRIFCSYHVHC